MIKIAVTPEAFANVEATLPLGTVGVEPMANEQGEREIWIDKGALNKLRAMRGPGESYNDAILRTRLGGDALTRDEHLDWCRKRALEHLDVGDLTHAVASMASDLKTHPDTDNPALNGLVTIGMMYVTDGDKLAVQRWIERFR